MTQEIRQAAQKGALIVGAGEGLSASIARKLAADGFKVALAARNTDKLSDLVAEINGIAFACDASHPGDVSRMFCAAVDYIETLNVVIFNAAALVRGPIAELDPVKVERALRITAFGGFLVGREAAQIMEPRGSGTILFTGATAGVKGFPQSAAFAMGKFALRGLAQSMARELGPKGIHVAHIIIDGGIRSSRNHNPHDQTDKFLDPVAIADAYMHLISQPRSVWTHELDMRPWVERF
jgi:NAD(P)-dependent dehydrogenase (short-subunit alcohol dehydrogenase family)